MNKMIAALRKVRFVKVVTTFVAGILLFFSTACNSVQAETPSSVNPRPEIPNEDPRATGYRGGMNDFSDVDPRAADLEKAAADKAAALKENAAHNINDQAGGVREKIQRSLDNAGDKVDVGNTLRQGTENVKQKVQGTAEDLKQGTNRGVENIKDNTRDATEGVTSRASQATENVKDNTRQAARDLDYSTNRAADNVRQAGRDAANSAQRTADNTSNYLQDKTTDAGKATQRALYKAGDKVGETVD